MFEVATDKSSLVADGFVPLAGPAEAMIWHGGTVMGRS
jgi:hypothetical protein